MNYVRKQKSIIIIVVLIIAVIAGLAVAKSRNKQSAGTAEVTSFSTKRFGLSLYGEKQDDGITKYDLIVQFNDSYAPKSRCPAIQQGFEGTITIKNQTASGAEVVIAQNKAPYSGLPQLQKEATCPMIAIMPIQKRHVLSLDWLQSGSPDKALTVQNQKFILSYNRIDGSLTLKRDNEQVTIAYSTTNDKIMQFTTPAKFIVVGE